MKKLLLILAVTCATAISYAQVATNGGSGLAATYPNLADAITALNAATISSPVIITVTDNQTAPTGGYQITASGTAVNTIEILGKSATITASASQAAGNLNDAVFKIVGGDYITIRDFTIRENAGNTTSDIATNNMTEWGVAVLPVSGTNGAQNNTIRNMNIELDKAYANSFGIYSSTAHTPADVTGVTDITAASGGNDNLKIVSNAISNVNIPVAIVGSPAYPGLGLNIGGNFSSEGNIITDWGTTSLFSAYARFDNLINYTNASTFSTYIPGILAVNQLGPNISHNTITSNTAGNADGALVGIYAPSNGAITYPGTPFTTNINGNSLNLYSNVFGSSTAVPLIYGIRVHTGDALSTLHIDTTEFQGANHVTANSPGSDTLIYSFAQVKHLTMNANKFQNLQIGHTGNLAFLAIHGRVFMPLDGTQNIMNNVINGLQRPSTAAVGTTVGIVKGLISNALATDGSEAASSFNVENNNFSNINTNGGGFTAVINFDGKVSLPTLSKNIIGNIFSNIDTRFSTSTSISGGAVTFANFTGRGGTHTVSNNLMENINTANPLTFGNVTGVTNSGFTAGMSYTISGNIMRSWDGAQLQGISFNGPANISNNQFYEWNGRTTVGAGNAAVNMTGIPAGAVVNITKNKIGDITNPIIGTINAINAGASTGIAANLNIYNNFIGNLKTPIATNFNAINGINITSGSLLAADVAHNTVYLNATSSSITNFGTSCILFNASLGSLKLRNNILMNLSTPGQEGLNSNAFGVTAVLRRSAIGTIGLAPANYDVASNNNLFYVNPTAGTNNHLTYLEGGLFSTPGPPPTATPIANSQNTLAQLQAFMINRDQASVTENTNNSPFKSLTASDPNFLHVDPRFIFTANNAGMNLSATIADDIDGEARSATPDMGADEYLTNEDAWLLPVTLATLNGQNRQGDNLLTWITASEQNNRGFDVQRSVNGTQFTTVGFVASKAQGGNSQQALTYEFTDLKVAGNMYYRLQQTDFDGSKRFSNIVLVKSPDALKPGFSSIYPNPVRSNTVLLVNATASDMAAVTVTDASGKVIMQRNEQVFEGSNTINLDMNKVSGGIYFISVKLGKSGKSESLRMIKQ